MDRLNELYEFGRASRSDKRPPCLVDWSSAFMHPVVIDESPALTGKPQTVVRLARRRNAADDKKPSQSPVILLWRRAPSRYNARGPWISRSFTRLRPLGSEAGSSRARSQRRSGSDRRVEHRRSSRNSRVFIYAWERGESFGICLAFDNYPLPISVARVFLLVVIVRSTRRSRRPHRGLRP